jgi:DinB superfamily
LTPAGDDEVRTTTPPLDDHLLITGRAGGVIGSAAVDDAPAGRVLHRVRLDDAELVATVLTGVRMRHVQLYRVVLSGASLSDVVIDGEIESLTINGVDVAALVTAELDRRHPGRAAMRPTDAPGFRHAWDVLEGLWAGTVARARALDPALLHRSVDGEWSFLETLRHLAFATDAWVRRVLLGEPDPWHPLDLPWDEMRDTPGIPRDRAARPSLAEVLALRADRTATVRSVLDTLTDNALDRALPPVDGPGWPRGTYSVRDCLQCVVTEEWEHRLFAERDLDVLTGEGAEP